MKSYTPQILVLLFTLNFSLFCSQENLILQKLTTDHNHLQEIISKNTWFQFNRIEIGTPIQNISKASYSENMGSAIATSAIVLGGGQPGTLSNNTVTMENPTSYVTASELPYRDITGQYNSIGVGSHKNELYFVTHEKSDPNSVDPHHWKSNNQSVTLPAPCYLSNNGSFLGYKAKYKFDGYEHNQIVIRIQEIINNEEILNKLYYINQPSAPSNYDQPINYTTRIAGGLFASTVVVGSIYYLMKNRK